MIVKVCRVHGELTAEHAFKSNITKYGIQGWGCRECRRIKDRAIGIANLSNEYIIKQLKGKSLLTYRELNNPVLIELKRGALLIKRAIKNDS